MKIGTFNVNSVRARLPQLLAWLETEAPDIVLLQEIKTEAPLFPRAALRAAGYEAHVLGQKSYNGVATLYRTSLAVSAASTPLLADDPSARYLEAEVGGLTLINVYVPNGNPMTPGHAGSTGLAPPPWSEKFSYKVRWLDALLQRAALLLTADVPFLIGGDFNIIPTAADCHDPVGWEGDALFNPTMRAFWRRLLYLGLTDAFRALHPDAPHAYTFWDYQAGAWRADKGLRIDHFLLSPRVADRLDTCSICREVRGEEKASDHTPVTLTLT